MPRLRILLHNFLYLFAIIALSFALLFSLARGLTPLLNAHKNWFENLATRFIGQPVLIGEVEASFSGLVPKFNFHKVTILTAEQQQPLLYLKNLQVGIDILRTLLRHHFIANFISIDGVSIVLKETVDGKFRLNGQRGLDSSVAAPLLIDGWLTPNVVTVLNWILTQPFISFKNVTFSLEQWQQAIFSIPTVDFVLINQGQSHRLRSVAGLFGKKSVIKLDADLTGNMKQRDSWHGTVYWQDTDLSLKAWLNKIMPNLKIDQGLGKVSLWVDIKQGDICAAQAQLNLHKLAVGLTSQDKKIALTALTGNLFWQRNMNNSWSVATQDLQWINKDQVWPIADLLLTVSPTWQSLYSPQLDFKACYAWIKANSWLPDNVLKSWRQYSPQGQVKQVSVLHTKPWQDLLNVNVFKAIYGHGKFNQFSINPVDNLPGVTQLNGELIWRPDGGAAQLDSSDGSLLLPKLFAHPLPFTQFKGGMLWRQTDVGWRVKLIELQFKNAMINSLTNMNLYFSVDQSSPHIDLLTSFHQYDSAKLKNLFPSKIMTPSLLAWLNRAFIAGEGANGVVVMRGHLANFPYLEKQGQFIADLQVKNLTFHYAHDWPSLEQLNGRLRFDPTGMYFDLSKGILNGSALYHTQAKIPLVLNNAEVVKVRTQVEMEINDAIKFTQTTPLKKTLSGLAALQGQGKVHLNLSLNVPLNANQQDNIALNGGLTFTDGKINLLNWDVSLEKVNGMLNFSAEKVWAKCIKAHFLNHPANIQIKTIKAWKDVVTRFIINSRVDIASLKNRFYFPLLKGMQGSAAYHGILSLPNKGGAQKLQINSELQGISIDLPYPYGKLAESKHPFSLQANFTPADTQLYFAYPPQVAINLFYLNKEKCKSHLQRGIISLGNLKAKLPSQDGLIVTGYVPAFNCAQWWPYWQKYFGNQEPLSAESKVDAGSAAISLVRLIDIETGKLTAFEQTTANAKLKIQRNKDAWQADLTSSNITGRVRYPNNFPQQAITANFRHFYLNSAAKVNKTVASTLKKDEINFKEFLPITFGVDDFRYRNRQFGAVNVNFIPISNKNKIKFNVAVHSAALKAKISGDWQTQGKREKTYLIGDASFTDLGYGLKAMGLTDKMVNGKGQLNFQLAWQNSPFFINENSLRGNAKLNVKDGTLIGFSQQTNRQLDLGKLINLFSVQSLLQRLRLNFSDLARSGYRFSTFRGSYKFSPGSISTDDTTIQGDVANIYLRGQANMRKKNYNVVVKITPHYTTSVPLLLVFLANPLAGAAALAANEIMSVSMDKVTQQTYAIMGPWANPQITKLEK